MKSDKLQDAINNIDDRFIEEAEEMTPDRADLSSGAEGKGTAAPGKISWFRRYGAAIAACAVLAIVLGGIGIYRSAESNALTGDFTYSTSKEAALVETAAAADGAIDSSLSGATGIKVKEEYGAEMAVEDIAREEAISAGLAVEDKAEGSAVSDVLIPQYEYPDASAFVLTAGVWNDNHNWPFFTNLVNSGIISFPSYGLDPRHRVSVKVTDEIGDPIVAETVELVDDSGEILWSARTDKEGNAYLFYVEGMTPTAVRAGDVTQEVTVDTTTVEETSEESEDAAPGQGGHVMPITSEIHLTVGQASRENAGLQVMFVIDTTGSMSDELAYLQKDFASIASEAVDGIDWSVNFYRDEGDEYVTQCHDFTKDVAEVQAQINSTVANGGGDTPEAVTRILDETISLNDGWQEDSTKLLFLVFDAPPHIDDEMYKLSDAVKHAAELGIRIVPVVASNAERDTELFGRALSIMTGADYVFLTNDSGVGDSHLEPIIGDYDVELLHDIIVRMINEAAE